MKKYKNVIKVIVGLIVLVSILHLSISMIALESDTLTPGQALISGLIACSYMAISIYTYDVLERECQQ